MESHCTPIVPMMSKSAAWTPSKDEITLFELFGGIATGLEALLQSDMAVKKYINVDMDPCARQVAEFWLLEFFNYISIAVSIESMELYFYFL